MASYRTPNALSDVRVLDLIELSGSTVRAAPLLNMSQPSVSRRRRRLAAELGLVSTSQLRQGDGACLRLLRQQQLLPVHLRASQHTPSAWLAAMEHEGALALATPLWQRQLQDCSDATLHPVVLSQPLDLKVWLLAHRRDRAKQPKLETMARDWAVLVTQRIAEA